MIKGISELLTYLHYPFVLYALGAGVMIALSSSLLGVPLVLRRFSFIGDGLAHVAFSAMAVASILGVVSDIWVVLPITILSAVLLLYGTQRSLIQGDAAVAMISVGALAIGYLLMNVFTRGPNLSGDVCSTLFGSTAILTLSPMQFVLCLLLSILVIVLYTVFYRKIFAITFDDAFAQASGIDTRKANLILAVIIAVVIVLAMNLVGALLVSALVVFPAISAMRICDSFLGVTLYAASFSIFSAVVGVFTSIMASTPVGATIVTVNIAVLICCQLLRVIRS